ncbi:uncharacterized protein METZ01_LOCUS372875, partial [marine metagenome]
EEEKPPGPFEVTEDIVWRVVNRSHTGADGIFVQATFRTFAYEVSRLYAEAEKAGLEHEQLQSRLRELVYAFIDGSYPMEDGTDINNLYFQYLIYVNDQFDLTNPLERAQFNVWRGEYVRRLLGIVSDRKYPLLRSTYDERWGRTCYSRLVFTVYISSQESELRPQIADIGARTCLIDEEGNRYLPSGTAGPYPYEFDRPEMDVLDGEVVYRVFFPNRRADRKTPIVSDESKKIELVIERLGSEPERRLTWNLPLQYPEMPGRRLNLSSLDTGVQLPK